MISDSKLKYLKDGVNNMIQDVIYTPPYYPQAKGKVERMYQNILLRSI